MEIVMSDLKIPHLLFENDIPPYTSGEDVTEDLKLDALLPEGTTHYLRVKPSVEGTLLRRELFAAMLADASSTASMLHLKELLSEAMEAGECVKNAVSDNAKSLIFPEFAAKMVAFYLKAATDKNYGKLYSNFSKFFKTQTESEKFISLCDRLENIQKTKKELGDLCVDIDGIKVTLSREPAQTMQDKVAKCAEKYGVEIKRGIGGTCSLQKSIIEAKAKLYPKQFAEISEFYRVYGDFFPTELFEIIPEFTLAVGLIELTLKAQKAGIPYCFPEFTERKELKLYDVYDIALLLKDGTRIVPNDVNFDESEPFFYLTGANGGGKTTYLRALGSAALLFSFGAPVFCRGGCGCLIGSVWTHFPKDERFEGSGRFADEQRRVDEILNACNIGDIPSENQTAPSLVLLNETYSTTHEDKAIACTSELAGRLYHSGSFGLYITHQHDINEQTIPFLGVLVDEADSNRRTYRIERRRLGNRSFAADILIKYGITRDALEKLFSANDAVN